MLRKKCYATVIGAAIVLMLVSCSGGPKRINLAYTPGATGPFPRAAAGQEVIVNTFKDSRPEKHIGEARNYSGHVFFTVEADNDVSAWVTNAVAAELEKSGFKVTVGENVDNPEKFVINGNISQVWAHGIITEMRVTIQVVKDYKIILNKSYSEEGSKVGRVTAPIVYMIDYLTLYDIALQDLMEKMIPQIITAINQSAGN